MSVSKWSYIPAKCDGDACPGDCDCCSKWDMCPPGHDANDCANDAEMCEVCWERFRAEEPPKEEHDG